MRDGWGDQSIHQFPKKKTEKEKKEAYIIKHNVPYPNFKLLNKGKNVTEYKNETSEKVIRLCLIFWKKENALFSQAITNEAEEGKSGLIPRSNKSKGRGRGGALEGGPKSTWQNLGLGMLESLMTLGKEEEINSLDVAE